MIARAAGVSLMTVSYAMRDRPEVSVAERRRIRALAEKIGYRPDPLLTHLMAHLRAHRTPKTSANLAVLTMLDATFVRRLITGATARAGRLGYNLDCVDARAIANNPRTLTRMLLARGVTGVLLAPAEDPAGYSGLLDWRNFAAVAMTYSLVEPHVNRVVTHHYDNAVRTFALLTDKGFRRIGLAMTRDMEFRANHSYSGAYYRMLPMSGQPSPPLLFLDEGSPGAIARWFAKYQPDAVVLANANHLNDSILPQITRAVANRTAFVCLDHDEAYRVSGIDQLFETIGSHAVDTLVAQLHRNERGLPENPTVTMVEGQWLDTCGFHPFAVRRRTKTGAMAPVRTTI